MKITWIIALVCFLLAIIFDAWSLAHGVFDWHFLALLGLFFWCLSGHPSVP